ncbi:MAG: hypothetical protein WA118_06960 [Carboxydocellales bacterium]
MQPVSVTGIEITYISGALQRDIDFRSCKTFISIDGVVRATFKRGIKESCADEEGNYMLPVSETYEYKIDYKAVERIFDRFDLFDLQPVKNDIQADDGGSWKMTIHTNGQNIKLKGYQPPEPFGDELSAEIVNLLDYKIVPMLF